MRILYVEDNPELRDTITILMEGPGRTVAACADASQALQLDQHEGPFDLVVSDVGLPGMSGLELCRQLLATDARRHVVLCTGYRLADDPLLQAPNVHTLLKPFDILRLEELLDTIQADIQRRCADTA